MDLRDGDFSKLKNFFRQIKWAWQRVFQGWDNRVTWDIGYYLAENMPDWLEKLKEDKAGIPISMFTEEELSDSSGHISDEAEEQARKRWDDVLTEIIIGFEAAESIINYEFDEDYDEETAYLEFNRGMDLFKEHFFSLWD